MPNCRAILEGFTPAAKAARTALVWPSVRPPSERDAPCRSGWAGRGATRCGFSATPIASATLLAAVGSQSTAPLHLVDDGREERLDLAGVQSRERAGQVPGEQVARRGRGIVTAIILFGRFGCRRDRGTFRRWALGPMGWHG